MAGKTTIITKGGQFLSKAMPGIAAFFGLEWATNGGVTDATSGLFGIPEWVASLGLIIVCVVAGAVVIKVILTKSSKKGTGRRS